MVNPELIAFMAKQKLDGIIAGDVPEMLTETKREGKEIELKLSSDSNIPDAELKELKAVFVYAGHTITITN